jgi:hypothetical protein
MRLENYLQESVSQNIVKNLYNKIAKMSDATLEYQLKINWYEFVDKMKESGKEENLVKFINSTFHLSLSSLDDVNLHRLKINLPVQEAIDYQSVYDIICKLQEFFGVITIGYAFWAAIVLRALARGHGEPSNVR